jgi:hypothetical protein
MVWVGSSRGSDLPGFAESSLAASSNPDGRKRSSLPLSAAALPGPLPTHEVRKMRRVASILRARELFCQAKTTPTHAARGFPFAMPD